MTRMAADTLTLADFLLVRIAEDSESISRGVHPGGSDGLGSHLTGWEERRWLGECEAKRRIVESYVNKYGSAVVLVDHDTLRLLALPYADHADYDETWRP